MGGSCGKVTKLCGELTEDNNYLKKGYLEGILSVSISCLDDKNVTFWYRKDIFPIRVLSPDFWREKGEESQSVLLPAGVF